MSEEIKEVDTYKIFRQLEERKKRANPYIFYDKDELIDEILKQEDKIEDLQQKVEQLENIRKEAIEYITTEQLYTDYQWGKPQYVKILKDLLNILNKGDNK